MGIITLTDDLRAEYARLYAEAEIPDDKRAAVAAAAQKILDNWSRYETVAATLGIPPHPIALIHAMESGCDFSTHLHNGDPLTARTVHQPPNRPATGEPPYTWEASAMDALRLHKLDQWGDWSIPGLCYVLERYNGWGYRLYHAATKSPYLWSFTSIYTAGKYVADGKWSSTAVSQQVGAVALLIELIERGYLYSVQEAAHETPTQDVAATPTQPAAPGVPASTDDVQEPSQEVVPEVGAGVSYRARVLDLLIALSKSKTIWGVVGMLGAQLLGVVPWDIGFRIGSDTYTIPDPSPYLQPIFASLAVWGRITAKPLKGAKDA